MSHSWLGHHFQGQRSRSPGCFTHRSVYTSGSCPGQARSTHRREALRRPPREERGRDILWWLPHRLFQARLTDKNFGTRGIYTILCWSSDAPPPSVLQKFPDFFHCAMSSSTRCDAVIVTVCLLSWTHHFWSASWRALSV